MRDNFFRVADIYKKSHTLLSGMLGALIILLIVEWFTPAEKIIATVDITAITQNFIKEQQTKNMPQNILEKEVILFGQQLGKILQQFAEQNHLVLLPKEAVMAGSEDYTAVIAKIMDQSIPHGGDPT